MGSERTGRANEGSLKPFLARGEGRESSFFDSIIEHKNFTTKGRTGMPP
jgi:hypothetical protein